MKRMAWLPVAVWFACGPGAAADEFKNVKCGADIPKAIIGQRSVNEKIVKTEARYSALGLKHLGADEISDKLSSINYLICGAEFVLLVERRGTVPPVVKFMTEAIGNGTLRVAYDNNGLKDRPVRTQVK